MRVRNMRRSIILLALHLLLFGLLCLLFGLRSHTTEEVITVKSDTIRVTDTVTVVVPQPIERAVRDTIVVHTTDTFEREVIVTLPREVITYQDSTYRAVVSGYRPTLDSLTIYHQRRIIKMTEQLPPPRWSIGLQGGVGVTPKGVQPYIGVGVSYRLGIK